MQIQALFVPFVFLPLVVLRSDDAFKNPTEGTLKTQNNKIIARYISDMFNPELWSEEVRMVVGNVDIPDYRARGKRLSDAVLSGVPLGGIDKILEKESPFFIPTLNAYLGKGEIPPIPKLGDPRAKWEADESTFSGILPLELSEQDLLFANDLLVTTKSICNEWVTRGAGDLQLWLASESGAWHCAHLYFILKYINGNNSILRKTSVGELETILKIQWVLNAHAEKEALGDPLKFRQLILYEIPVLIQKIEAASVECRQAASVVRISVLVETVRALEQSLGDLIIRDPLISAALQKAERLGKDSRLLYDYIVRQTELNDERLRNTLSDRILAELRIQFRQDARLENSEILLDALRNKLREVGCCGGGVTK